MKCPKCNEELLIVAQDLDKERISLGLKYEGAFIRAETVGGVIINMQKLLSEVAKETGHNILVAFESTEQKEKELIINFLILPVVKKTLT